MPQDPLDADLMRLPPSQPGMRIGILGGSFDPPHRGHVAVSHVALKTLALDEVWWLVSPQNPLKPNAPSADLARRVKAARALVRHPRIHVTGIEATFGTTYTADTLRRLFPRLAGVDLVWMMGADSLAGFHRWRDWQAIAASLPLAVFNRPGSALRALASPAARSLSAYRMPEASAVALAGTPAPAWIFLSKPHVALSSTALRMAASKTKSAS
jgi:nicotinate-nucleotide adenylyltransferase